MWLIFCLFWAGVWVIGAILTAVTIIGFFLCLLMAAASCAAILLPIGKQPQAVAGPPPLALMPPCLRCGAPASAHNYGRCPQQGPSAEQAGGGR
jgi:hypothetical protein